MVETIEEFFEFARFSLQYIDGSKRGTHVRIAHGVLIQMLSKTLLYDAHKKHNVRKEFATWKSCKITDFLKMASEKRLYLHEI